MTARRRNTLVPPPSQQPASSSGGLAGDSGRPPKGCSWVVEKREAFFKAREGAGPSGVVPPP